MTAPPSPDPRHISQGLAWVGVASSLVSVLDVVGMLIILGFWIDPEQLGIATQAVWIFPILDHLSDMGLAGAVVQHDRSDEDTISTVFWINLAMGVLLFAIIVVVAPIFARGFVGHAIVGSMLIVYGTKLIWQNVYAIPAALMRRQLRFKELSVIRILTNTAEFTGKVGSAAAGAGVWCFVIGPMCRVLVAAIAVQLYQPWRPRFVLRLRQSWEHTKFGLKTSGSQILFFFYSNIDYPIVAYYFGAAALGIYRMAYDIVLEPVKVISYVVVELAFPTFARLRHTRDRLIAQFISFTRLNLVTVMTYAAVVFVTADDLVPLFFPNYLGAEDAIRILCGVAILRALSSVVPPMLNGTGHPNRTLVYMLTASIALPLMYLLCANLLGEELGFNSVAVAWALGYPIAFAVLIKLAVYTLEVPLGRFLRAVIGVPICAAAAAVIGLGVQVVLADAPVAVRLAMTTAVIVGVLGMLLAYTQGLSIRGAVRALRGEPADANRATEPGEA